MMDNAIRAVLFDRDGTLIADDSNRTSFITPMPHAREALNRLRERGFLIGVITNQPDADDSDIDAVHWKIDEQLGPIDGWFVCRHSADAGCLCRKPRAGLILKAASAFGVLPGECAVVGDIGSDIDAAQAAGAFAILVPTPVTLREEIERAPVVCSDLGEAVDRLMGACAVS